MASPERWKRDEFLAQIAGLDLDQLCRVLWNVYWRGGAGARERLHAEIEAAQGHPRPRQQPEQADPGVLTWEVEEFCRLARAGAYLGGTREVSRKERSNWRLTFRRLFDESSRLVVGSEFEAGADALERLVDLACETSSLVYFRSQDPVEAAKVVISDHVELLWRVLLEREGFAGFARRSAAQLIRWEEPYGWTCTGSGVTAGKEATLAKVLGRLLHGDAWAEYAEAYVATLDHASGPECVGIQPAGDRQDPQMRAERLREWHDLLLEALHQRGGRQGLLHRIANHSALAGPCRRFLAARIALLEGDARQARELIAACLQDRPGDRGFREFAERLQAAAD